MTSPPDVSVVIAAYNAMPYLVKCVESVLEQSIGAERLEIIAVDDGSTDGTGEELDRFAARCPTMRVVHQENSGGPAQPRNVGLDLATGRYVFFLDADDWLGAEALERMVATADANGSDVVLGKMVGVGGRTVPLSMFRRNQPRTTVFDSNVYWALGPTKLFRRALLEDLGLRFDPRLTVGQDQPFTATAYLNASVISVVADYDCYYAVRRDDGGNNTSRPDGALRRLPFLRAVFDLLTREVEAGPKRDRLLRRHFQSDQREFLTHLLAETDPTSGPRCSRSSAASYAPGAPRRSSAACPPRTGCGCGSSAPDASTRPWRSCGTPWRTARPRRSSRRDGCTAPTRTSGTPRCPPPTRSSTSPANWPSATT